MEDLELSLNIEEASSLFLLLEISIDTLNSKGDVLKDIKSIPEEDRPKELMDEQVIDEALKLNEQLKADAYAIKKEVSQIIIELAKPKGPIIIPSPKFKASKE